MVVMTQLLFRESAWVTTLVLMALMGVAWAIGYAGGRRLAARGAAVEGSKIEEATLALMGLLLVVCRNLSQRMLLVLGFFVALAPALAEPWIDALLQGLPTQETMERANIAAFSSPRWALALAQNLTFSNWAYLAWWGVFPFVFGRFLLGYWAGR